MVTRIGRKTFVSQNGKRVECPAALREAAATNRLTFDHVFGYFSPRDGQIWRDMDPRRPGRLLRVVAPQYRVGKQPVTTEQQQDTGKVRFEVLTFNGWKSEIVRVDRKRLKPGARGYELIAVSS